jgi:Raf kinase inhibitor-like YbhB/YbcL family protein
VAQALNIGSLKVTSPSFGHHEPIPELHSGDGQDVAPALAWEGVPDGTEAFAIVVHDPDAPLVDGFTHWVGIPGDARGLPEGGDGARSGVNSFGERGYNGPAPPPGHGVHHYYFWLYALDQPLEFPDSIDREVLLRQIEDHVIEQARLVGTYESADG